jgi:teichuronic acid biosynthesis glycosyltransferase TuaC
MKILYISDPYPSPRHNSRGAFSYKYVQILAESNHQITVYSPENLWKVGFLKKRSSYGIEKAIKVFRPLYLSLGAITVGRFNTYQIAHVQKRYWLKLCLQKGETFDLVICQFISSALYYLDSHARQRSCILVDVGENRGIYRTMGWYQKSKYFSLVSYVSAWVAVSDDVKTALIDNNICKDVLVLHNGVKLSYYAELIKKRRAIRNSLSISDDTLVGVFVGRFMKDKGYFDLIEAAKGKHIHWIFLGGQDNGEQSELDVIFCGSVKPENVGTYLVASDFFVLPTYHEGASNSIVEAMAAHLPIVSTNIPSVIEQTNKLCGPLVNPGDIQALSTALDDMCSLELRSSFSKGSKAQSGKFSAEFRMNKMIEYGKNCC